MKNVLRAFWGTMLLVLLAACGGGGGGGGAAAPTTPTTPNPPPTSSALPVPTITAPTSSTGTATIRWSASSGATRYELQRRSGSGAWSNVSTTLTGTSQSQSLGNGSYQFRVRACNSSGCSGYSSLSGTLVVTRPTQPVTTTPPPPPATFTVPVRVNSNSATISWASSTRATSYQLQRSADSTNTWTNVATVSATSHALNDLSDGDKFRVRACIGATCSTWQEFSGDNNQGLIVDSDGDGTRDMEDDHVDDPGRGLFVGAVGAASVSTCNISVTGTSPGAGACSRETGSIKVNDVDISSDRYLNFLMVGGDGSADVGMKLYKAGTTEEVATFTPNTCTDGNIGPMFINADVGWSDLDVSSLTDVQGAPVTNVDIEIYDNESSGSCGFIGFDHLYLSDTRARDHTASQSQQ